MNLNNVKLQDEINDNKVVKPVSYYRNFRVAPEGTAPTQFNNSNQTVLFSIPSESIVNFSKITLCFRRTGTALYASTNATTDSFYIPSDHCNLFQKIEVFSGANNARIMEVVNADIFSKLYTPLNNEYIKNSLDCGFVYPAVDTVDKYLINSSVSGSRVSTGLLDGAFSLQEVIANTAQGNVDLGIRNYNIRLGDIYGGIFNLNKSVYISKNMYIRLTLNPVNRIVGMCLGADSSLSPNTVASNSVINIVNWALNIYTETNPLIIESIKNENKKGQVFIVPDIIANQYNIAGGAGNRSIQFRVINGTGDSRARLYRVYTVLSGGLSGSSARALNPTSNYSSNNTYLDSKYNQLSLYVNSQNILQLDLQARDHVQHMINQHKTHCLFSKNYIDNWGAFATIFDTSMKNDDVNDTDDELKGLDFGPGNEVNLQFQYNLCGSSDNIIQCSGQYTNYSFAEVLRPILFKDGLVYTSSI